jgi:hypothetical protein
MSIYLIENERDKEGRKRERMKSLPGKGKQ